MGKRNRKRHRASVEDDNSDDDLLLAAAASAFPTKPTTTTATADVPPRKQHSAVDPLPPPFPLLIPSTLNGFLSNKDTRHKEIYETAMRTCYEGVKWEEDVFSERRLQAALQIMDDAGFFRVDITQPAGLGAKCAPTFVTRCLVGEQGMTYRYLGLRMFAHPWHGGKGCYSDEVADALRTFSSLNTTLTERSKVHLKELDGKKRARDEPGTKGRAGFDVSLINKMTATPRLKDEPMYKQAKCTVSWHADSSLEHYSTIAVYQTILGDAKPAGKHVKSKNNDADWSVALRVAHNAEGPKAARLGSIDVNTKSPPVTLSLPTGSVYYLLDDANHHLQHAVLAPKDRDSTETRYSSTHRLLREGAQVSSMITRCEGICQKFAHHGPKRWRIEQLLLSEIESEWLRQFYIQGQAHKDLLWGSWKEPISQLFRYWSKLEMRTFHVAALLRSAARTKCGVCDSDEGKHALVAVQEVYRTNTGIFDAVAQLIADRAKTRDLWAARERDPSFKRVDDASKPLTFPVQYNVRNGKLKGDSEFLGVSPFPDGSAVFLERIAEMLRQWGEAYAQGSSNRLPREDAVRLSDGELVEFNFDLVSAQPKKKKSNKKRKRTNP